MGYQDKKQMGKKQFTGQLNGNGHVQSLGSEGEDVLKDKHGRVDETDQARVKQEELTTDEYERNETAASDYDRDGDSSDLQEGELEEDEELNRDL